MITVHLLTTAQFAVLMQVSTRTLYRWHASGQLVPHIVLPGGRRRYLAAQVDDLQPSTPTPPTPLYRLSAKYDENRGETVTEETLVDDKPATRRFIERLANHKEG